MSYVIHTTVSWTQTMREIHETMAKWGVADWDVYKPSERGGTVMLKYVKNGRSVTLPMGSQARADDNLRVLYLAVEAMRLNERRGMGEVKDGLGPEQLLALTLPVTGDITGTVSVSARLVRGGIQGVIDAIRELILEP